MTAVAFRRAHFTEDDEFNSWVSSLTGDEPSERQAAAIDPAQMHIEMPDIPLAGSGGGDNDNAAAGDPLVDAPEDEGTDDSGKHDDEGLTDRP